MKKRCKKRIASLLTLVFLLVGCSKASEPQYMVPPAISTICLDRILIDVPGTVEMGVANAQYDDVPGFDGIKDIGGKGLRWGNVAILETVPTDAAGYDSVYQSARPISITLADYNAAVAERRKEIQTWVDRTKSGTSNEIATAQRIVDKEKKELDADRNGFKVSGEAELPEKHAFAIRRDNNFTLGYLDAQDHRVRMFEGKLSHPELESPKAAAEEFQRFQRIYHARMPTAIPETPGFCTSFGLIDELSGPEMDIELKLPFRIRRYPNLIFILTLSPASSNNPRNIQKLPFMGKENAKLALTGVKGSHGPVRETILGTPGRSYGQEYGPRCSPAGCTPPKQAYDIEAETYGVPGRADQPHLILHMTAATSDDYKLALPFDPDEPSANKPDRPALSGHVPPPFKEGQQIFEQVLRSIRLRPGAIATPSMSVQAPASGAPAPRSKK